MLSRNDTPFAAIGFADRHRDGAMMAVVAVRGRYNLMPDGVLRPANEQDLVLSDVYEGDPHRTPLVAVGDLIPYKPGADVTVLGSAHAPGGRPAARWTVSVGIGDRRTTLMVHGPREWETALSFMTPTWKLGAAKPTVAVPLDWRMAAGGRVVGDPDGAVEARNPIGPGLLDEELTRRGRSFRAPQIDTAAAAIVDPFVHAEPQGFGPVPPFWATRQRYVGTCDEAWQRERAPRLPSDFDYRFHQSAPPALIFPGLRGDEEVRLHGIVPGGGALAFKLPAIALVAHHAWFDARRVAARLSLDGLHIDLRKEPWRIDLTWRGWIETCPNYDAAALVTANIEDVEGLPFSGEHGLVESARW